MSSKKTTIGLVFGGNSSEHEVSIKSAKTIYNAFSNSYNRERFIVNPVYIDKNGFWENSEYSESVLFEKNYLNNIIKDRQDYDDNLTNFPKESNGGTSSKMYASTHIPSSLT